MAFNLGLQGLERKQSQPEELLVDVRDHSPSFGSVVEAASAATDGEQGALPSLLAEQRSELWTFLEAWACRQEALVSQALEDRPAAVCSHVEISGPSRPRPDLLNLGEEFSPTSYREIPEGGTDSRATDSRATDSRLPLPFRGTSTYDSTPLNGMRIIHEISNLHMDSDSKALPEVISKERNVLLRWAERLESRPCFPMSSMAVILLNAFFMVGATEYRMRNLFTEKRSEKEPPVIEAAELVFLIFYSAELLVRLLAKRVSFWIGEDLRWNIFDFLLVVSMLFEWVMSMAFVVDTPNMSYLRVLRLMRMVKVLRFVRLMAEFRELRLVLDSLLGSVKCMLWATLFVVALTMTFGLVFVQATLEYLKFDGRDEAVADALLQYFGSVPGAMLSLFFSTTGGTDWADVAEPLWHAGGHFYLTFIVYVGFWLFVFMNTLTSIFLDAVQNYASSETKEIIGDHMNRRQQYVHQLTKLFKSLDQDGSGEVAYHEIQENMHNPELQAFARSLDIEVNDLRQFSAILSAGGRREISLDAFVVGCIKYRGAAKGMDMAELLMDHKQECEGHRKFERFCREEFERLRKLILSTASRTMHSA